MSLSAMRQFKRDAGKDLWYTLVSFLECYALNSDDADLTLMRKLYAVVDFETASHVFHCLAKEEDSYIELEQIQDAMFRVGWRPNNEDEFAQPWPLIMVQVATQIDKTFNEVIAVKKKEQTGSPLISERQ